MPQSRRQKPFSLRELRVAGLTEKTIREHPRSAPLKWKIARPCAPKLRCLSHGSRVDSSSGSASNVCHKMRGYFTSTPSSHQCSKILGKVVLDAAALQDAALCLHYTIHAISLLWSSMP